MKRLPFEPPTKHYDTSIQHIDEQLCNLLNKRKEQSNDPGFPPLEKIVEWSMKYNLYEDFLSSFFGSLLLEEEFRPRIEPEGFLKHVPVLKSVEVGENLYTITFIRQFENASVVHLTMDWYEPDDSRHLRPRRVRDHAFLQLEIDEKYDCRTTGGGGSTGHMTYDFVVSPPLPDDVSGLILTFKEYSTPFKNKPTGMEIVISISEDNSRERS
ncbi:hypothetical protein SM124_15185 [Bacillus sp. 31A1R]|uniref:Uncharacterized protein n=1 Tax=Robertmurraya mangrovi TaxID=3098077 RepID=A0ABU5J0Y2_9BACI|nr:hypothetical protein [Bacillus sp. 31A1R]MDZ5473061.1 hypothetical protein [Bacillus sp. 31A1R]